MRYRPVSKITRGHQRIKKNQEMLIRDREQMIKIWWCSRLPSQTMNFLGHAEAIIQQQIWRYFDLHLPRNKAKQLISSIWLSRQQCGKQLGRALHSLSAFSLKFVVNKNVAVWWFAKHLFLYATSISSILQFVFADIPLFMYYKYIFCFQKRKITSYR